MRVIKYKCLILSDMFIHGADNKQAQMQAVAFKSSMRFWWRALQDKDGKDLLKEEVELFGGICSAGEDDKNGGNKRSGKSRRSTNTEKTIHVKRSPFDIEVNWEGDRLEGCDKELLPHKKRSVKTGAFPENSQFQIVFTIRGKEMEDRVDFYMALFELASLLGGVGQRARRGAGSYQIIERIDGKGDGINPFGDKALIDNLEERMIIVKEYGKPKDGNQYQCKGQNDDWLKKSCSGNHSFEISWNGAENHKLCKISWIAIIACQQEKGNAIYKADCQQERGNAVYKAISHVTHEIRESDEAIYEGIEDCKKYWDTALGSVNTRLASPVIASIAQMGNCKYVIVTGLTYDSKTCDREKINEIQQCFVDKIGRKMR